MLGWALASAASSRHETLWSDERGVTAVFTALCLTAVLGLTALGAEAARLVSSRRQMQTLADTAATAGALAMRAEPWLTPRRAAMSVLRSHPDLMENTVARVRFARVSRSANWTRNYVAVTLQRRHSAMFGLLLGAERSEIAVQSVAELKPGTPACVVALSPERSALSGESRLALRACTSISADDGVTPTQLRDMNPWRDVRYDADPPCVATGVVITGSAKVEAGSGAAAFCGGLHVATGSTLFMSPGTYEVRDGSLVIDAGASLVGDRVTIVLGPRSSVHAARGSTLVLRAPETGKLAGLAIASFEQAPQLNELRSGSGQSIDGAIYLPTQVLHLASSGSSPCTQVIADRVRIVNMTRLSGTCGATAVRPARLSTAELVR